MDWKNNKDVPAIALAAILLTGMALRVWISFRPLDELEYKIIPDDSFYYLQTARHIVAGDGSTFDGFERHNGYHPLWMTAILPIFAAVPDNIEDPGPVSAIRAVMILGALLDMAAALLLAMAAIRITKSRPMALMTAGLYFLNPYAVFHSVEGLETPLLAAMLALTTFLASGTILGERLSAGQAAAIGAALGLTMLARTDAVFFAAPMMLFLLVAAGNNSPERFKPVLLSGIVASVLVFPWFLFSRLYVGSWTQSSADAAPYIQHINFIRDYGPLSGDKYWGMVSFQIRHAIGISTSMSPIAWLVIPAALVLIYATGRNYMEKWRMGGFFAVTGVYCIALLFIHAGLRWMARSWYYEPLFLFAALLVPVSIWSVFPDQGKRRKFAMLVIVALMAPMYAIHGTENWREGLWPSQKGGLAGAKRIMNEMPPGMRIGSSDAGLVGYFGPPFLANLDGVANESARKAIKEGRLLDYCVEKGVMIVGIRRGMMIPEIMGPGFDNRLASGPAGYLEIKPPHGTNSQGNIDEVH